MLNDYNVILTGSGWTDTYKYNAALGVTSTGRALTDNFDESASAAFIAVYEFMTFEWNTECYGCRSAEQNASCGSDFSSEGCRASGAVTLGSHYIVFASMSSNPRYGANHVVHELGHAISPALGGRPYEAMKEALQDPNSLLHRPSTSTKNGFASAGFPWQQAVVNVDQYYEIWADQFVGWVFNTWESSPRGQARSDWMISNMAEFLP